MGALAPQVSWSEWIWMMPPGWTVGCLVGWRPLDELLVGMGLLYLGRGGRGIRGVPHSGQVWVRRRWALREIVGTGGAKASA